MNNNSTSIVNGALDMHTGKWLIRPREKFWWKHIESDLNKAHLNVNSHGWGFTIIGYLIKTISTVINTARAL